MSAPDKNTGRAVAAATAWKKRRRKALLPEMSTVPKEGGWAGCFTLYPCRCCFPNDAGSAPEPPPASDNQQGWVCSNGRKSRAGADSAKQLLSQGNGVALPADTMVGGKKPPTWAKSAPSHWF